MTPKKATKQSSITSMGFPLLQKPTEMCVDRQFQILTSDPTGRGVCQMKKRIHCTSAPCTSIMCCTSGMQVAHPLKQWSFRRWVWMDRTPRNRRILCRSHFLYEVPAAFLTTLVHNLSPTTSGHNDHRFFSCFPLICWWGLRHDR